MPLPDDSLPGRLIWRVHATCGLNLAGIAAALSRSKAQRLLTAYLVEVAADGPA